MRRREQLGWALVGALSFLVLIQGYELVAAVRVGFPTKGLVALAVAGVTAASAPYVEWLITNNGSP